MLFITRETMEYGEYRVAVTDTEDNTTEWVSVEQARQLVIKGVKIYGAELTADGALKYTCFQDAAAANRRFEIESATAAYNARYIALGRKPLCRIKGLWCIGVHCEEDDYGRGFVANLKIPDCVRSVGLPMSSREADPEYHSLAGVTYDSLTFPKTLRIISYDTFRKSVIKSDLRMPDSVFKINEGAFKECKIQGSLYLPRTISDKGLTIEQGAFENCTITGDLHLPGVYPPSIFEERNLVIADGAFKNCRIGGAILCDIDISYPPRGHLEVRKKAWKGCTYWACSADIQKIFHI